MPRSQYDPSDDVHGPLHVASDSPVVLPNVPAGHGLQLPTEPPVLYCPTGHADPTALVAPMPQYLPALALHADEQFDDVKPVLLPKRPIGHTEHMP